jgi:tetratricopeptide (TPR) repeat protein
MRQALALLEEAIDRDPHYGLTLGLAAQCCQHLATNFNASDRDAIRPKGIDFGRRAVEVAGDDPGVLADAAMALAVLGEDLDAMIALVDRALAFNPSYARGWHISGFLRLWARQTDHAIEHGEMALRLSPRAGAGEEALLIGTALFLGRQFEEAVPRLWVAIEAMPLSRTPTVILLLAMPKWGCSTRRARRSRGCARSCPRKTTARYAIAECRHVQRSLGPPMTLGNSAAARVRLMVPRFPTSGRA